MEHAHMLTALGRNVTPLTPDVAQEFCIVSCAGTKGCQAGAHSTISDFDPLPLLTRSQTSPRLSIRPLRCSSFVVIVVATSYATSSEETSPILISFSDYRICLIDALVAKYGTLLAVVARIHFHRTAIETRRCRLSYESSRVRNPF